MSDVTEFKKNPQNYLKHHRLTLGELSREVGETFLDFDEGNKRYRMYQQLYIDITISKGGPTSLGVKKMEVVPSGVDTGLRMLPWKDSALTYMKLDDSARWFLTGPIEGCYIYVARNASGTPYVFHANANAVTGLQNVQAKDDAVKVVLTAKNLQLTHRLGYSDYNQTGFTNKGFVYGWKDGAGWRFHVHSLSLIGKYVTGINNYRSFVAKRYDKYMASTPLPGCGTL